MQLNPNTISILKEWKEDETQRLRLDEFIQLEEKDLDLAIDFSVKKYPTKRSKCWGLSLRDSEKNLEYYKRNPLYFIRVVRDQCCFGRKLYRSIRTEINEQIPKGFHLDFFESFEKKVYNPFKQRTDAFYAKREAIRRHDDKTRELDQWEFSVAEDFLDLDSKKEEN